MKINQMQEKDLISKLNNLQAIKPDSDWKERNRQILLSQISASSEDKVTSLFAIIENLIPNKLLMLSSRPALMFMFILALVLSSGAASYHFAKETKPGDSLYIAKIISEKTQLALTFDETQKAKLNLEFASNRTKELTQVLEKPEGQDSTINNLSSDFKKEISAAKTRLSKIDSGGSQVVNKPNDNSQPNNNDNNDDEKVQVYGANVGKDDSSLQLSEKTPVAPVESSLNEAEKLFDQKKYKDALNKIDEANKIIDNPKTASSTKPVTSTSTATSTK